MVENPHARRVEQNEQRPRVEIGEKQREEIRARFEADKGNDIEARAAGLKTDSVVERMDEHGKPEKWRILEVHGDIVTLGRGARQEVISRKEAVLEARAAEYGPSLAKYWDSVMVTTEAIPDPKHQAKAKELLGKYKIDIMRMAALTVANDNPADLEAALHRAMQSVIESHADDRAEDRANAALGRVIDANDGLLELRFGPNIDFSLDEVQEITTKIGIDRKGATPLSDATSQVAQPSTQPEHALPAAMAEAAAAGIDVPHQALAPARGEITAYAALDVMFAFDGKQLDITDIDAHLAHLDKLREQIDGDVNSFARSVAILDIQDRQHALLSQRATMSAESLGAVQQMLQELQAQKPVDRKRGRPVDVGSLMLKLQIANIALRGLKVGTPKWSIKTQENWALEKRILEATGHTEELRPENFSQVYAYYKEAMQEGKMSKEDILAALEDLGRDSNILTGKDAEGLRILFDELISDPVGSSLDDDLAVTGERLVNKPIPPAPASISKNAGRHRPIPFNILRTNNEQYGQVSPTTVEVEDDEPNDDVGSSLDEDIEVVDTTHISKNARKHRPIPLNAQRAEAQRYGEKRHGPRVTTGAAELSNEPAVVVGKYDKKNDNRKGPNIISSEEETLTDFLANRTDPVLEMSTKASTSLEERDNKRILRPDLAPPSLQRDYTEDAWMQEGDNGDFETTYAPAAKVMEKRANPDALYGNVSVEAPKIDNEPFRRIAEVFGGAKAFRRLNQEYEDRTGFSFDLEHLSQMKKLNRSEEKKFIAAFSEAVGIPVENKEQPQTPLEQVSEAFGGQENFEKIYQELEDANLAPYDLENLRNATKFKNGQAKDVIAEISRAVQELEKNSGRDTLMRPPTPLEHIAEEFGGMDIFKKNLEDLTTSGRSPYTLEDLKNIPEPTFFQRLFPWRNPTEKAIREIRAAMKPKKKRGGLQS